MYRSKILLVDDDADITTSLKIGLEDNGFIVDAFNDPLLAIINKPANFNLKLKSHILIQKSFSLNFVYLLKELLTNMLLKL